MKTILDGLRIAETDLTIKDSTDTTTYFQSSDVYIALYRYVSFDYCCRIFSTVNDFLDTWHSYLRTRAHDIDMMWTALHTQYDPLSNYDLHEHGANAAAAGKQSVVTTPEGKTTVTAKVTGTETITLGRQGADSSDYEPFDQTKTTSDANNDPRTTTTDTTYQTGTKSTTDTTYTNDQTATLDGQTVTGHELTEHVLTRKGNIGVTTSQQMLESELNLRQFQLLADIVSQFAKEHLTLVWGCCR